MSPAFPDTRSALRDFVLDYCRLAGGILEPPAYGVYDVLLPEETAARLGIAPFQRFAFDEQAARGDNAPAAHEITFLHYGHPLLERIVGEVRQQPACARLYVSRLRLDKRGLADLAGKALSFPNARLFPEPKAMERAALHHYVRFNFKAGLVTDEVRELVLPAWMYVQGGYALEEQEAAQLVSLEESPSFENLPEAPPTWRPAAAPLSPDVLAGLLERARQTALERLAAPLAVLQQRANRFLELDRARLEQYYDDLRRDLEGRRQRAAEERQDTLQAKQAAVEAERQAKLADAEEKYRLRVTLEVVNLLVVVQPKVLLPMQIKNRSTAITRPVVWDPLLRRIEPLACDVCGRPGAGLWLCTGGHLAHAECLLPQCVDCKRVYCHLCRDQMTTCVVCDRPLCLASVNRCPTCGRGTCHEHLNLCHAAAGEPQRVLVAAPTPPVEAAEPAPLPVEPSEAGREAAPTPAAKPKKSKAAGSTRGKSQAGVQRGPATRERASPVRSGPTAQEIEVYVEMEPSLITAYAVSSRRNIAVRTWMLSDEGIAVSCRCEKGYFCPANGLLLRPEPAATIEAQIWREIRQFREEYQVAGPRVSVYQIVRGRPHFVRRLALLGRWKDPEVLARAQAAFDQG